MYRLLCITFVMLAAYLPGSWAWAQAQVSSEIELRFVFGLPTPGEIALTNDIDLENYSAGSLTSDPESDVTVTSANGGPFTITQTCPDERIFTMQPFAGEAAALIIDNLVLTGGNTAEDGGGEFGGAIFSAGDVHIQEAVLRNNEARLGGAILREGDRWERDCHEFGIPRQQLHGWRRGHRHQA